MKNITTIALAGALLAATAGAAVTEPVGYTNFPIPGTGGGAAANTFLSTGFLPSDSLQYVGTAESFGTDGTGNFLQDNEGTWSPGDFVNGSDVSHLVEIVTAPGSAALEGSLVWITATDTGKLYTSDDLSAAGAGTSFKVLKAFTFSTFFGAVPDSSVLGGGTGAGAADNVLLLDPSTGIFGIYWYKNGGLGGTGWRGPGNIDATSVAIHPSDGLVIQRKQVGDGEITITGSLKPTKTDVRIEGDGSTTVNNIVSFNIVADQLTFGNTGLYTGDPATGLLGGSGAGAADNILISDGAGGFDLYWYKNAGLGGTGWRGPGGVDATNIVIPGKVAVIIQRKAGNPFNWEIPAPVVAP